MKKCICQICACGRHRCPHTLGQQNRVINKDAKNNCKVTEYRGRFDDIVPKRGPFPKPTDLIKYEGPTPSQTTNATSYVTHEVKVPKQKEPEKFVPNPHRFDAVSEHHEHYRQLNGIPARIPPYLKTVTMRKPSARVEYISTKQDDFKPWTSPAKVEVIRREQPYRPPSKPFKETSLHRQDFKHFHQPPNISARQPDNLNFGDVVQDFQTTTQTYHKALKASPTKPIERQPEIQALPKSAFTNTSVFKADFVDHKTVKSAHMFKSESQLFRSNETMARQTTQTDSFKAWPVTPRQRKPPDVYKKPEGKIEITPISHDYSNHGELGIPAKSARPRTKLRRGREFPFDSITSYSTEFPKHTATKRATVTQNTRDANDIFPTSTEGPETMKNSSEFFDKYKGHHAPPARMFKDNSTLFKTSARFADSTLYHDQFRGERIECPTEALLRDDKVGLFTFDHVNEEGHKFYDINPRASKPLRREVTVM